MRLPHRKILFAVLGVAYLLSATFVEIGHNHADENRHVVIAHHASSEKLPAPKHGEKDCAICQHLLQFTPTLSNPVPVIEVTSRLLPVRIASLAKAHETLFYFSKRGPPFVS